MIRHAVKALAIACLLASPATAQSLAKELFGAKTTGSNQRAAPHGGYAKGCLAGGIRLPETGPTWQAMRLSRNRNWGHPETVKFIERLSASRERGTYRDASEALADLGEPDQSIPDAWRRVPLIGDPGATRSLLRLLDDLPPAPTGEA